MALSPIEANGMISRSQDISIYKINEDNKGMLAQENIGVQVKKNVQEQSEQVKDAQRTEYNEYRYDAKEKGNGAYQQNKKKQKEKKTPVDGIVKERKQGGFDMRI